MLREICDAKCKASQPQPPLPGPTTMDPVTSARWRSLTLSGQNTQITVSKGLQAVFDGGPSTWSRSVN